MRVTEQAMVRAMWGRLPEQEPEELFETVSQCLLSGVDRDALSGWGAIVYVMCAYPSVHCLTPPSH
jgi:20S proteasome alpha/beta subunit